MMSIARMSLVVAATLAALAIGGAVFVGSGVYNIGADDHHTKIVLAVIEQLRDRSIAVRARSIEVPALHDPARIARRGTLRGALRHLSSRTRGDEVRLRTGLYPHPPNLAQEETAMPADILDHQTWHQDERHARVGEDFE